MLEAPSALKLHSECVYYGLSWLITKITKIAFTYLHFHPVNVCCHLAQNVLSSSFLSKNIKIKIHRTIILPVVCMGVKFGH